MVHVIFFESKKYNQSGIFPVLKYIVDTQPEKHAGTATISSITTEAGSRSSRMDSALVQKYTAAVEVNNIMATKNIRLFGSNKRMNRGIPSRVPNVPGALVERPVPKP